MGSLELIRSDSLPVLHNHQESSTWSAVVRFPIRLQDNSGIAHVLEHVVSLTNAKDGASLATLADADISANARTEFDQLSFYFTAGSAEGFRYALRTILSATLEMPLSENVFRNESFRFDSSEGDKAIPRGSVYQEMESTFYGVERQLDWLTRCHQMPTPAFQFDPGGDPTAIRRLKMDDLAAFAANTLVRENCHIFTCGPASPKALLDLPTGTRHGGPVVGRRPIFGVAKGPRAYVSEKDRAGSYTRFIFHVGVSTSLPTYVDEWLLELALDNFRPLFEAAGHKFEVTYVPEFSRVVNLGAAKALGITFLVYRPDFEHSALQGVVLQLLRFALGNLPAGNLGNWIETKALALNDELYPGNRLEPSRLMLLTRLPQGDHFTDRENLFKDSTGLVAGFLDAKPLSELRESLSQRLSLQAVVLKPADTRLEDLRQRDRRFFNRLLAIKFQRDVPRRESKAVADTPKPASSPRAAEQTKLGGDNSAAHLYIWQRIYNISLLPLPLVPLIPLFQAALHEKFKAQGLELETFVFSHALPNNGSVQLLTVKGRGTSRLAVDKTISAWSDALDWLSAGQRLDSSLAVNLLGTIKASPVELALWQSSFQGGASEIIRLWRGLDQLRCLAGIATKQIDADMPIREIAGFLQRCPASDLSFSPEQRPRESCESFLDHFSAEHWPIRNSGCVQDWPSSRLAISSPQRENLYVRRVVLPLDRVELVAALLIMEREIDAAFVKPFLRSRLGAYAAFAGIELGTFEYQCVAYRTPRLEDAVELFRSTTWSEQAKHFDENNAEHVRSTLLSAFNQNLDQLNSVTRHCYSQMTHSIDREFMIVEALKSLSTREAKVLIADMQDAHVNHEVIHSFDDLAAFAQANWRVETIQ